MSVTPNRKAQDTNSTDGHRLNGENLVNYMRQHEGDDVASQQQRPEPVSYAYLQDQFG